MSKKSKTTSQSTTVQTPNVPSWIQGPYQQYTGQVASLLNSDPSSYSVGANANQQAAWQRAGALTGSPSIGQGTQAMQGLLGYTPQSVSMGGNSYTPNQMGATGDYTAAQLGDTDLSRYTSPFQQQVIDASMADYDNLLGQTFNSLKASTPTGAFGGSRQGVAMGQAGADAARQQAGLLAGLRQSGFQNAQQAALQDIAARNQFRAQQNADLFGREQFNVGARNAFQAQQNADNLATQQFNSGQDLAGAQFRSGAARSLFDMGVGADQNERANIGLLGSAGDQQREIELANNPELQRATWLATLGGLLGQAQPQLFTGQTTNQNATSTSRTSDPLGAITGLLGGAGTIMSGIGMLRGAGAAGGLLGKLTPMRDASGLTNLRF